MAEKKIVDVAGPKDAKIDIGGKPMIVGHKSLASDPMVRNQDSESAADSDAAAVEDNEKMSAPSEIRKVIAPISTDEKSEKEPKSKSKEAPKESKPAESESSEPAPESETKAEEPAKVEEKEAPKPDEAAGSGEEPAEDEKKEERIDPAAEAMEREAAIRHLIDSKKYRVNIKQARGSSKGLIWTLIILLLASLFALFYLVDTDKLDLGFDLPVNVFGKEEPVSAPAPVQPVAETDTVSEDIPEEENPASERTFTFPEWFVYEAPGYTVSLPDGWLLREKEGDTGSLFSPGQLAYEEGERAVVEEYSADSAAEGMFDFVLDYMPGVTSCEDFVPTPDTSAQPSEYKTMDDLLIKSYLEEGTKLESERTLGELAAGERQYRYCVSDGSAAVYVTYFVGVDDEVNDGKFVDSLVESVSFKAAQTQ